MSEEQNRKITETKTEKQLGKARIFSLIETLGMYCLYAGVVSLIISYFVKYGFAFEKLSREQIFELFIWGARGGLIFAIVVGLPIWLSKEYGTQEH